MGLRFSRRIRLLPGVHLNLGLKSLSLSLGPRGAAVTVGPRGVHGHVGLPGTGLSYRARLDGGRAAAPPRAPSVTAPASIRIRFDRQSMQLLDENGTPLRELVLAAARKAFRQPLIDALDARAAELNAAGSLQDIPDMLAEATRDNAYPVPKPVKPADPRSIDPAHPDRATADVAWADYMAALGPWRAGEAEYRRARSDPDATCARLAATLAAIAWSRETLVSLDMEGTVLRADVDLPEIEDLPSTRIAVSRRDLALVAKPLPATALRRAYECHISSIACRIVGEAFAVSPTIDAVHIAGYTQRPCAVTGAVEDVYVLAATVAREAWGEIHTARADPVSALAGFRRQTAVDAHGEAHPIVPLARA